MNPDEVEVTLYKVELRPTVKVKVPGQPFQLIPANPVEIPGDEWAEWSASAFRDGDLSVVKAQWIASQSASLNGSAPV